LLRNQKKILKFQRKLSKRRIFVEDCSAQFGANFAHLGRTEISFYKKVFLYALVNIYLEKKSEKY